MKLVGYEVKFFSIGNASKGGDMILIRLEFFGGIKKVVLIDGGYSDDAERLADYLINECGTNSIDLVINTHPDQDHIAGLIKLFENGRVRIKKLVLNTPFNQFVIYPGYFVGLSSGSLQRYLFQTFSGLKKLIDLAKKEIGLSNIERPVPGDRYFDVFTVFGPSVDFYRQCLLASDKTPETKPSVPLLFDYSSGTLGRGYEFVNFS